MVAGRTEVRTLRLGSRGSALARWQAGHVAKLLKRIAIDTHIEIIKTTGDHLQTASLTEEGGKGLFTKEIEQALLDGSIDIAVHSLKDLPTEITPGLTIAAIPEREDPRDALVGSTLLGLKQGGKLGTSSERRAAQLRHLRPDVLIEPVRGNVDTRLRKLKEGQFDAIMLAVAGLKRLGFESKIAEILMPEQVCPAPGQGALAIQTRADDPAAEICRVLDHSASRLAVEAEREVLQRLGGGCQLPMGAFAERVDDRWTLSAIVISPGGSRVLREKAVGAENPGRLAEAVVQQLIERGAADVLAQARHEAT